MDGLKLRRDKGRFLKGFHYSPRTEFTSEGTRIRNKVNNPMRCPEVARKAGLAKRGKRNSPATELQKGDVPKNAIKKGEHRGKQTEFQRGQRPSNAIEKGKHLSPKTEFKKGLIPWNKGMKNCWSKEKLRRILTRRAPNKEESYLIDLFDDHNLPYRFVGDGQVTIGGRNPDFININGKKQIIEFFGEHWHDIRDAQEKRTIYNAYGFEMLGIWGKELRNPEKLISKILKFEQGGHNG